MRNTSEVQRTARKMTKEINAHQPKRLQVQMLLGRRNMKYTTEFKDEVNFRLPHELHVDDECFYNFHVRIMVEHFPILRIF